MRPTIIAAVAAASLALSAGRIHAQDYAEQIWTQLQAMRNIFEGYSLQNYIIGHMADDRTESWTISLAPNSSYTIGGACDTDCSDLDIVVKDASGKVIAQDQTDDDVPIVEIRTTGAARYTIEVKMYECSAATCYFGFGLFRE